jgi:putative tryptophan/tyrosine transport system substrate-binding protein
MASYIARRKFLATLLGGAAAAWPLAARAQQGSRGRRIVALMSMAADDPEAQPRVAAFESGLRELGWLDGHNLRVEYRWVSDGDLLRRNAAELARMPPDLILATSTPVMAALREQGLGAPIMFVQVTDPVGNGFVASLARPGGNITGFTNFEFSIGTKWLEALKQIAPRVTRVALIYNPETAPYADLFQRPVEAAAPAFAVMPITVAARSAAELERAVDAFARTPTGGLLVLPDVTNLIHRDQIIALAARHRLPAVYPYLYYAASGGLLSYGSEQADVFRRAASYVDRILKGTSPGELPVQAPTKYELVINLKTAKALDLEVPPMLIARADEVIE